MSPEAKATCAYLDVERNAASDAIVAFGKVRKTGMGDDAWTHEGHRKRRSIVPSLSRAPRG